MSTIQERASKYAEQLDDWFWIGLDAWASYLSSILDGHTHVHLTQEHREHLSCIVREVQEMTNAPEVIALCQCARRKRTITPYDSAIEAKEKLDATLQAIANAFLQKG